MLTEYKRKLLKFVGEQMIRGLVAVNVCFLGTSLIDYFSHLIKKDNQESSYVPIVILGMSSLFIYGIYRKLRHSR